MTTRRKHMHAAHQPERVIHGHDVSGALLKAVVAPFNDLSEQGLELWLDDFDRWHWLWRPLGLEWHYSVKHTPPSTTRDGAPLKD